MDEKTGLVSRRKSAQKTVKWTLKDVHIGCIMGNVGCRILELSPQYKSGGL